MRQQPSKRNNTEFIYLSDDSLCFEIRNVGLGTAKYHHCHLILCKCGNAMPFKGGLSEKSEDKMMRESGIHVMNRGIKLCGCCAECGGKLIEKKRK